VDDVPGRQPVPAGNLGRAGIAAVKPAAFGQQIRSGRAMDRAVDPAAAEQRAVRRVDDGVDRERGDVGNHDVEPRRPGFGAADRAGLAFHAWIVASSR
jgi:hypothetical protein